MRPGECGHYGDKDEALAKRLRTEAVLYVDRIRGLSRVGHRHGHRTTCPVPWEWIRKLAPALLGATVCGCRVSRTSEIKLPGSANAFNELAVAQHLKIDIALLDLLTTPLSSLHLPQSPQSPQSPQLRSFGEPPLR